MSYTLVPSELIVDGAITSAKLDTNISISGTLGVTGELTLATHLNMGDNDKIKIGTGGDLEIYHDGSNSYIANSTGNIYIADTNGAVHIQAKLNEESIVASADGAVTLYHDNSAKLATASGGVTVTGTLTATTLAGTLSTAAQTNITSVGNLSSLTVSGDLTVDTSTLKVDSSNNRVGIGTSSPSQTLSLEAADTTVRFMEVKNSAGSMLVGINGSGNAFVSGQTSGKPLILETNNTERMRIDSGGRVMIAETSNSGYSATADDLIVGDNGSSTERGISLGSTAGSTIRFNDGADAGLIEYAHSDDSMRLYTAGSERMRINSSGSVSIGTQTSTAPFNVQADGSARGIRILGRDNGTSDEAAITFADNSNNTTVDLITIGNALTFFQGGTETLRLDSSGRLGIGTNSPATEVQIGDYTDSTETLTFATSNDGTARLNFYDNNNTEGLYLRTVGEAYGGKIFFGARWDDDEDKGYLKVLQTSAGGATDVQLSLGTTSPANTVCPLFVQLDSAAVNQGAAVFSNPNSSASRVVTVNIGANANLIVFDKAFGSIGSISTNGSSVAYNTTSDYRLKENIDYTWDAITRLKQLKPARFNFISDETNTLVDGFLAHEVSSIVPEAIKGEKDAVDGEGNPEYQGIDQSKLIPLLTKAIQEQQAVIEDLKTRIETLEG